MKHVFKSAALLFLVALLFTSCKDCETTVTQIELEEAKWLVYERNDTARFLNVAGDTVDFVHSVLRADQVPGTGTNVADDCISHFDVQAYSIMENRDGDYPALATYILKRKESFTVQIALMYSGGQSIAEYNLDHTAAPLEVVEINGERYFDVYEILMPNEAKSNFPKRILFNKTEGFLSVEFVDEKKLEIIS